MSVHVLPVDELDLHTMALTCTCAPRVAELDYLGRERLALVHHDFGSPVPDTPGEILATWRSVPAGVG